MNILLLGANGFIGQHIKQAISQHTHHSPITPTHQDADFNTHTTPESWQDLLQDIDIVINAVGIIVENQHANFETLHTQAPIALFEACQEHSIKHIIQISALGADEHAYTPYQNSKFATDQFLRQLTIPSTILRPSLVYGKGGKSLAMFQRLSMLPLIPLPDGGTQHVQPVHVSDLVNAVLQSLPQPDTSNGTIDVVGPKAITLADYIQSIRHSLGKTPAKIISIPFSLCIKTSAVLHPSFPMLHPNNLRMLQQGNTANVSHFAQFIGHMPISVSEGLQKEKNS